MGRQASAASRNAQKWQVAGGRANEASAEFPSEDEHGGSTRISSSGGASPSASSSELSRQANLGADTAHNWSRPLTKEEVAERARWADVESDGEEVRVFEGEYKREADSWASASGKKSKSVRPPPQKARPAKPEPAPPAPRQAASKQPVSAKQTPYRPAKEDSRHSAGYDDHYGWEASSWGISAWSTSAKRGGGWSEGSWSTHEVHSSKADYRKGHGKGGFKEKNESFKNGPQVSVNMDSSRLAW